MNIGTNGLAIANKLESINSMGSILDFLDKSDGTIKQTAEITHG